MTAGPWMGNDQIRRKWLIGLTAVIAALYAWIGLAAVGLDRALGLAGGVLILAALVTSRWSRVVAGALIVMGALPLAAAIWWSIVTPLLAALALLLGGLSMRPHGAGAPMVKTEGDRSS